jgi:hypothetical protein
VPVDKVRERTLWIVLLAILALIVFWLVLRYWHMREPGGEPKRAAVQSLELHRETPLLEYEESNRLRDPPVRETTPGVLSSS